MSSSLCCFNWRGNSLERREKSVGCCRWICSCCCCWICCWLWSPNDHLSVVETTFGCGRGGDFVAARGRLTDDSDSILLLLLMILERETEGIHISCCCGICCFNFSASFPRNNSHCIQSFQSQTQLIQTQNRNGHSTIQSFDSKRTCIHIYGSL